LQPVRIHILFEAQQISGKMGETVLTEQTKIARKHPSRAPSHLDARASIRIFITEAWTRAYFYTAEVDARANGQIGLRGRRRGDIAMFRKLTDQRHSGAY
jgi:hypothetical protein